MVLDSPLQSPACSLGLRLHEDRKPGQRQIAAKRRQLQAGGVFNIHPAERRMRTRQKLRSLKPRQGWRRVAAFGAQFEIASGIISGM